MLIKKVKSSESDLIEWIKSNKSKCIYEGDDDEIVITTEWLVGSDASRCFYGKSFSNAWNKLKQHLTQHINSPTVVGNIVRSCQWPNYRVVLKHIKSD